MNSPLLRLALLAPLLILPRRSSSPRKPHAWSTGCAPFLDAVAPFLDRAGPLRDDTTAEDQRVYPDSRLYRFSNSGYLQIQTATGRVLTYLSGRYDGAPAEDADGNVVPRGVDDAEAAALVRRVFAAGWTGSVRIIEIADLQGNNGSRGLRLSDWSGRRMREHPGRARSRTQPSTTPLLPLRRLDPPPEKAS